MSPTTLDLVQNVTEKKPSEFSTNFAELVQDRIRDLVAAKRMEVATNMFRSQEDQPEQPEQPEQDASTETDSAGVEDAAENQPKTEVPQEETPEQGDSEQPPK